jgi:hypothetical protein
LANPAESSDEGYGLKRAALLLLMMMMNIKFNQYLLCGFGEDGC